MNLPPLLKKRNNPPLHHEMLPDAIRMLIIGGSNCGKTHLAVNLALRYIKWTRLYVITDSSDQELYDLLRKIPKAETLVHFITSDELRNNHKIFDDMPPLSLVIFDDFMMHKDQSFPSMVFSRGRPKKINVIYIAQKFTETNLVIRLNTNVLVMFKMNNQRKRYIYSMYASDDMELDDFINIKLIDNDFLVILSCMNSKSKKYIKNFKTYLF